MAATLWKDYKTVKVEKEDGITWCILNRPEKRNAMNPQLHYDMLEALTELEVDKDTKVLVITGAGPSWCAGQDLREYFRGTDTNPLERRKASWASQEWRWRRLFWFPKPTIAMVNGFCFGGALSFLCGTQDLALTGVIGFYAGMARDFGNGTLLDQAGSIRTPALGLFGGADQGIPAEQVEEFDRRLDAAGVAHKIVIYPGAPHSFFDRRFAEFAEASADAWDRVRTFIAAQAAPVAAG